MIRTGHAMRWWRHHVFGRARMFLRHLGETGCVALGGVMIGATIAHTGLAQQTVAARESRSADHRVLDALLGHRVTVQLKNVSRKRAIDVLSANADVSIQYHTTLLDAYPGLVNLSVKDVTLGIALERVLAGTGLQLVADGTDQLSIVDRDGPGGRDTIPEYGIITGRIIDSATGRGLGGVTVKVVGTKLTALTADSGRFTINRVLPGEQVVTIRIFGYRPVERTVTVAAGERTVTRIALAVVPTMLSQVVTTATGKQRKLEVGNDITALNVDSLQQVAPITSVTDLLEARVPGLVVMRSSGVPGAPSRIRLRGIGSVMRNNDPIVVIDGVRMYAQQDPSRSVESDPSDPLISPTKNTRVQIQDFPPPSPLDQLDPNSIETIEVLKGPSASAIYGSDAGNGVIVVTTKHGQNGSTQWSLSANAGLTMQAGEFPVGVYRFGHFLNGQSQLCWIATMGCTLDSVVKFQAMNDPRYTIIGSHGLNRDITGTVSGGINNLLYSLTASASRMLGQLQLPDVEAERFSKFHNGLTPPNWMRRPDRYATQGGTSQFTIPLGHNNAQVSLSTGVFTSAQQQSTLQQALSELAATFVDTSQLGQAPLIRDFYTLAKIEQTHNVNAITARWKVSSWLPLEATAGNDRQDGTQQLITPRGYWIGSDSIGQYAIQRTTTRSNTLTFGTTIPAPVAGIAAGFNYVNTVANDIHAEVKGIPSGVDVPTVLGPSIVSPSQSLVSNATYGWYVAPQFNFSSRFFVSPAIRLDGGSASGSRVSVGGLNGVSGFPKIDFSWLAIDPSNNTGVHNGVLSLLTSLRVRTAFGTAGVQPAAGDYLRLLRDTLKIVDGQDIDVVSVTSLGNTKLRPERSRELEGGIDAEFWNGRATVTFTQYQKMRYDAILPKPVAPSIFANASVLTNVGRISNTGLDLSLDAQLLQRAALGWHVNMTMSRQANRVVSLVAGQAPFDYFASGIDGTVTRITVGYPVDGRWAKPIKGYSDLNHDGAIQPTEIIVGDSLQYVGGQLPNYELNLGTDLNLLGGRLSFHTQIAYQDGFTQFNSAGTQISSQGVAVNSNLTAGVLFFGNDPSVSLAQQAAYAAALSSQTPIGLIQVVNTLRWQTLSANYVAPVGLAQFVRARRLSFAVQGSNLWLHTNYRGKDPNVNSLPAGDVVQDAGALPLPRSVSLKVTVGN